MFWEAAFIHGDLFCLVKFADVTGERECCVAGSSMSADHQCCGVAQVS